METPNPNQPLEVIRDGPIQATIWINDGEKGEYLTTTFARTYTNQQDELADTHSFSGRDLLVVAELAREAYRWSSIYRTRQARSVPSPSPES